MTENRLATMPADSASTERGLSRRDVLLAGLALPALAAPLASRRLSSPTPRRRPQRVNAWSA